MIVVVTQRINSPLLHGAEGGGVGIATYVMTRAIGERES